MSEPSYSVFKENVSQKREVKRRSKSGLLSKLSKLLNPLSGIKIFAVLKEIISNKSIRNKVLITLLVVFLYRALSSVPLPGIDMQVYQEVLGNRSTTEANYLFSFFTGGRLESPSIVGLGLAAYINASIIMQMLPYAINRLKEIQKQGERGKQIINQITRFLTLPLSFFYSLAYLMFLSQQDLGSGSLIEIPIGSTYPTVTKLFFMALVLSAGTLFLMWLSEIITEKGLGNGSSIIITIGILASLPSLLIQDLSKLDITDVLTQLFSGNINALTNPITLAVIGTFLGLVLIIVFVVFLNESQRRINVQYARRLRGEEVSGEKNSYLPIKLTLTGVLPVIFTYALLSLPQLVVPLLEGATDIGSPFYSFLQDVKNGFLFAPNDNVVNMQDNIYSVIYFLLVVVFGVFYAFIVMNPKETAENLQKSGAFIQGIRPGKSTEEFISKVLIRVSFIGAICLGFIALLPILSRNLVLSSTGTTIAILSGIGGTSILILVSVITDTIRQYRSLKATKSYERYL